MIYDADIHDDGYIAGVSTVNVYGSSIIGKEEYHSILSAFASKPETDSQHDYLLKQDLTWDMVDIPAQPAVYTQTSLAAMTNTELETILSGLGISANMNKANMIRLILYMQGGGADA